MISKPPESDAADRLVAHAREQARVLLDARAAAAPDIPADTFPGYTIVSTIRRGGQGVVYKATELTTGRTVAIKVLRLGQFASPTDLARFNLEVEALAELDTPGIVSIHLSSVVNHHRYFVMDYIDGLALDAFVLTHDPTIPQGLDLFLHICRTIQSAHLHGFVHRDLKPSNIRIDAHDRPYILDFGLTKLTGDHGQDDDLTISGQFLGTPRWAAPEQFSDSNTPPDIRTDIHALGLLLYFILTSSHPGESRSTSRVSDQLPVAAAVPPSKHNPRIPGDLDTIVLTCLQPDPTRRYQSVATLIDDIQRFGRHQPIAAKRDSTIYRLAKTARRRRGLLLVLLAFLTLATAAGIELSLQLSRTRAAEHRADIQLELALNAYQFLVDEVSAKLAPVPEAREARTAILTGAYQRLADHENQHHGEGVHDEHAMQAHFQLGDIALALGHLEEAQHHLTTSLNLRMKNSAVIAGDPDSLADLSVNLVLLGDIAKQHGDLQLTAARYHAAFDIDQRLADDNPEFLCYLDSLAWSYDRLAWLAEQTDPDAARPLVEKQIEIMHELVAAEPTNAIRLHGLAAAVSHLSKFSSIALDWGESNRLMTRAVLLSREATRLQPDDLFLQFSLAEHICNAYSVTRAAGITDNPNLDEALAIADMLNDRDPDLPRHRRLRMKVYWCLTNAANDRHDRSAVIEYARLTADAVDACLPDTPKDWILLQKKVQSLTLVVKQLLAANPPEDAWPDRDRALASIQRFRQDAGDTAGIRQIELETLTSIPGDPDHALLLEYAARVIQDDEPADPDLMLSLGQTYLTIGESDLANDMFLRAEQLYQQIGLALPEYFAKLLGR